jgi:threonine/homoserine/homoserine lactone efflux protein
MAVTFAGLAPETVAAFALTATVIELTPGPNMAWLAIVAATEGRRPAFAAVAGVALGLGIVGIAAALGLAALVAASPPLYQTLRWAGVFYLLWLAWDGWRGDSEQVYDGLGGRALVCFRRGLVTNLLNPKAAVFYVAVLPAFVDPAAGVTRATLVLSLVYVVVATAIHAGIAVAAGATRRLFQAPEKERLLRRTLSAVLAVIALWFAWKTRLPM